MAHSKIPILLALCLAGAGTLRAQITDLADFGGSNGANPGYGSLLQSGNTLYGTTIFGGANNAGEVFSVPVSGGAPTVLGSFNTTNGSQPGDSTLILSGGILYGMTSIGGANNDGVIFSLPVTGGTPTVLASFDGTHGANPYGGLVLSGGTLYGVTKNGGANGNGAVFSLPVTGGTPTVLASFNGSNGTNPMGTLVLSGGTLYGTTHGGGGDAFGEVFSLPVSGGTPTVLATFTGANGEYPSGNLLLNGGTLYGTAEEGGANALGVVYSVPVGGGVPTALASFNGTNGSIPLGGVVLVGSTLYGTTTGQGVAGNHGNVYSLPVTGGTPTVVGNFAGTNGSTPYSTPTLSTDGTELYGTTQSGGAGGAGTVFAVAVPEPGSAALLVGGIWGLATVRRRRSR